VRGKLAFFLSGGLLLELEGGVRRGGSDLAVWCVFPSSVRVCAFLLLMLYTNSLQKKKD
jgi:hypothetical protein